MKKRSIVFILILVAAFVFSAFSACSKKETFTVTFEANGGAAVDPITYRAGDEAIALPTTAREGYTFEGWWEDPSFGGGKVGADRFRAGRKIRPFPSGGRDCVVGED